MGPNISQNPELATNVGRSAERNPMSSTYRERFKRASRIAVGASMLYLRSPGEQELRRASDRFDSDKTVRTEMDEGTSVVTEIKGDGSRIEHQPADSRE